LYALINIFQNIDGKQAFFKHALVVFIIIFVFYKYVVYSVFQVSQLNIFCDRGALETPVLNPCILRVYALLRFHRSGSVPLDRKYLTVTLELRYIAIVKFKDNWKLYLFVNSNLEWLLYSRLCCMED